MDLADQHQEAANAVAELREHPRKRHIIGLPPLVAAHIAKSGDWVPPLVFCPMSRQLMSHCSADMLAIVTARLRDDEGFPNAGIEFEDGIPARIVFEKEERDPRN